MSRLNATSIKMSKKQLIYLLSNKAKAGAKRFNDCNLFKAIATRLYLQPNYENYLCKRRRWWYFKNLNHSNISMIIKLKHFIHTMTDSHQAIDCFRFVWTVFGAVAWPVAIACCIIFGGKKTRWVKVWLVHTFKVHFHGTNHNYVVKRKWWTN